jgi:hypothetical protein
MSPASWSYCGTPTIDWPLTIRVGVELTPDPRAVGESGVFKGEDEKGVDP